MFTTAQLADLAFPTLDTAQHRLIRLHRLGVFDRFRWATVGGSTSWHYTLGVAGAALRAAAAGTTPPRPSELAQRLARLATNPRLDHLLGVNGFFAALAGHARTHPNTALAAWWSERRCAKHYGRIVRPDGYGRWVEHGMRVDFFVEHDTGSEPLGRVAAKLPGYADLARGGGPACPVLIWLPSTAREANLHHLLATQACRVPVATASVEWAHAVSTDPAGPIWLTTPGAGRRRLVDLPAGAAPHGGERRC